MVFEFPVSFSLDTSAIDSRLEHDAYDAIITQMAMEIEKKIIKELPAKRTRSYYETIIPKSLDDIDWTTFAAQRLDKWLVDHAQDIIDEAAILLAQKAIKKKAWRDVLHELRESGAIDG